MAKYDIGLVCLNIYNYGNSLTNYALYKCLKSMGYHVLLIDMPGNTDVFFPYFFDNKTDLYIESPYEENQFVSLYDSRWDITDLNFKCNMFIVGSDQLWKDTFIKYSDYYTCLDWVASDKYKAAYGTSFGNGISGVNEEKVIYLLQRFQKIGLREKSSTEWLKSEYGIDAVHVMDPVFLCDREEYHRLAQKGIQRMPTNLFTGAYLLEADEWKCKLIDQIAGQSTEGAQVMINAPRWINFGVNTPDIEKDFKVEEWLALIENCNFLVTDSFHGLCLALIFHKQFLVVFNKTSARGINRIESILNLIGLTNRLITDDMKEISLEHIREEVIDYEKVDRVLSESIKESKTWLKQVVQEGLSYCGEKNVYDTFMMEYYKTRKIAENSTIECQKIKNQVWLEQLKKKNGIIKMVAWGAGGCFGEHIREIKQIYDLDTVCDKDFKKWGDNYCSGVKCIPPEELWNMKNVVVIIMANCENVAREIEKELVYHGMDNYIAYDEWSKIVMGK